MTRSRKILLGFAVALSCAFGALIYDVSQKTTFPGAKKRAKQARELDSLQRADTIKDASPPKTSVRPR